MFQLTSSFEGSLKGFKVKVGGALCKDEVGYGGASPGLDYQIGTSNPVGWRGDELRSEIVYNFITKLPNGLELVLSLHSKRINKEDERKSYRNP